MISKNLFEYIGDQCTFCHNPTHHILIKYSDFTLFYDRLRKSIFRIYSYRNLLDHIIGR